MHTQSNSFHDGCVIRRQALAYFRYATEFRNLLLGSSTFLTTACSGLLYHYYQYDVVVRYCQKRELETSQYGYTLVLHKVRKGMEENWNGDWWLDF